MVASPSQKLEFSEKVGGKWRVSLRYSSTKCVKSRFKGTPKPQEYKKEKMEVKKRKNKEVFYHFESR